MFVWLSEKIAGVFVDSGAVKEDDKDIYIYGLDVLLSTAANIVCILALGLLFGRMLETLIFLAFFTVLRGTAGGYHASTHFRCFLVMLFAYLPFIAMLFLVPPGAFLWISLPLAAAAAAVMAALAPVPHENKPVSEREFKKFRVLSLWLTALEGAVVVLCMALNQTVFAFAGAFGMFVSAASLLAVYFSKG